MKPLKVTITAFGPYKQQEVIDFTELDDHRLFVISGNTGAGKTTIFDAICFALYGEASGEERSDFQLLRSQFAEEGVHTSVELDFALHRRTYRVFRQIPHVKSGNKTATGGRYELYETTGGRAVPCVDRFHVKDINEKLEQIIGLSKDQFSQIVMLPQGEFRKLLTSETENKEEILRRIFSTGIYKRFAERLKEKKTEAEQHFDQQSRDLDFHIQRIEQVLPKRVDSPLFKVFTQEQYNVHQILESLDTEVAYYIEETEKNRKKQREAAKASREKTTAYHKAQALNEKFATLDQKRAKKAEMDKKLPQVQEKQEALDRAEKASRLDVYERHTQEVRQEEFTKQQAVQTVLAIKKETEAQLSSAQTIYTKEEAGSEKRDQIDRDIDRLEGFLPTVRDLDGKKSELLRLHTEQNSFADELSRLDKILNQNKERKQQVYQDMKPLEAGVLALADKQQRLTERRERTVILRDFLRMQKESRDGEKEVAIKAQASETVQSNYQQLERQWFESQAVLLAAELHDSTPCPVCGSTHHPDKASTQENLPSKETLDRLKKEKEELERTYNQAVASYNELCRQRDKQEEEVRAHGFHGEDSNDQYEDSVEKGKQLKREVDKLMENQKDLKKLKTAYERVEKAIDQQAKEKETANKAFQNKNLLYEKQKALYEQTLKDIPEKWRSLSQLQERLKQAKQSKERFESQWKAAQEQLQKAKEEAAAALANTSNAEKLQLEVAGKAKKATQQFEEALQNAGFADEEFYQKAKMSETDRTTLQKDIDLFRIERSNLTASIQELEKELDGQSRFDLENLSEEVERLEQLKEAAERALRSSEDYKKEAEASKQHITAAAVKVKEAEQAFQRITDLYNVVRGDNSRKISFERYLQIEFLEQIVQAANQRLERLSGGQFHLMRSERLEKRGRQSGLGLDVYDAYTGQTRDVKSLSGGEKFNASLCLALGMADVIQAFEGGISIETMFIDEGFGSLDEESLSKAIDTLIDLQKSGRMVGMISHVQELKSIIPAVLEVEKTKDGHSRTQFLFRS